MNTESFNHDSLGKESLALHESVTGKIGTELKVPIENTYDLSLAYTPGVAAVSREIAEHPERACALTGVCNTVAVVTDGSAVLGLGNIGPLAALPVMEGKAALFKRFSGVDAVPICLNTQDSDEIVKTVQAIAPSFGGINLEDIAAPRCFEIERRLIELLDIPVMHDDQHGTATVVLAALINALTLTNRTFAETRVVVNGAGAAGTAITKLLLVSGVEDITVCDSKGVIGKYRTDIDGEKQWLAEHTNPRSIEGTLADAIVETDVFVGVSKGGVLSEGMVRSMHESAIVFALANPEPEIMPDLAKEAGAAIVATGRSDYPNQINNVLVFPGVFRGALDNGVGRITDEMLVRAAHNLAALVGNPTVEKILPNPFDEGVAAAVASAIH